MHPQALLFGGPGLGDRDLITSLGAEPLPHDVIARVGNALGYCAVLEHKIRVEQKEGRRSAGQVRLLPILNSTIRVAPVIAPCGSPGRRRSSDYQWLESSCGSIRPQPKRGLYRQKRGLWRQTSGDSTDGWQAIFLAFIANLPILSRGLCRHISIKNPISLLIACVGKVPGDTAEKTYHC